jgi:PAS domain S-box-containing protein
MNRVPDNLDSDSGSSGRVADIAAKFSDAMPIAVLIVHQDGSILHCNHKAAGLLGVRPLDVCGRSLSEVLSLGSGDAAAIQSLISDSVIGKQDGRPITLRSMKPDGAKRLLEISSSHNPLLGEAVPALVLLRETTSETLADDMFRELAGKCSALADIITDGLCVLDSNGVITHVNCQFCSMLSRSDCELLGTALVDSLDPESSRRLETSLSSPPGTPISPVQLDIVRQDGTWLHASSSLRKVLHPTSDGQVMAAAIAVFRDISETREKDRALRHRDENYRLLVESARAAISLINRDGIYTFVNESAARYLGMNRDAVIGKSVWQAFPQNLADQHMAAVRNVIDNACEHAREVQTFVNGEWRWFDMNLQPFRSDQGEVVAALVIAHDIDQRKKAETELRAERDFVTSLIETSISLIVCLDGNGHIKVFNPQCEKVTGYSREEVIGKRWPDIMLPVSARHEGLENFSEWVREHPADSYEGPVITKSGEIRTILWSNSAIFSNDQVLAIAVGQDITERKAAETVLRESEERMKFALQHIPVMVDAFDDDLNLVLWNGECERVTGYTAAEMIGNPMPLEALYPDPRQRGEIMDQWGKMSDNYRDWELNLTCKDSSIRTISWSNQSHLYPIQGWRTWGIGVDVTERLRAIKALRESEESFRMIAEAIPIPVAVSRLADGKLLYANARIEPTFGYSLEEIMEMDSLSLYQNESDRVYIAQQLASGGSVRNYELQGRRKDGSTFWAILNLDMIMFGGEKCIFGGFVDVTERIGVEAAVRDSERRFRELADLLPQIVFEADLNGAFTFVNSSSLAVTGYSNSDLAAGLTVFNVVTGDDQIDTQMRFRMVLTGENTDGTEYSILRKDGTSFPAMVYASAIIQSGVAVGIRGIAIDITERKKAELELKEAYRRLRKEEEQLVQKNIALNEVLRHIEAEREQTRLQVHTNMSRLVMPLLQSLSERTSDASRVYIELLTSALDDLTSPFLRKLEAQFSRLTPREIQVCDMIRGGKTSKEIAAALGISSLTVHKFRQIIRKKLGITNKHNNLETFLKSV